VEGSKSLLTGKGVICAMVPHQNGVRYYLHEQSTMGETQRLCFPHFVEEIIAELVELKCDRGLAWRLLAISIEHSKVHHFHREHLKSVLVRSFTIVSKFRSVLLQMANGVSANPPKKSLFGESKELQTALNSGGAFPVEHNLFHNSRRAQDVELEPFNTCVFDKDDHLEINRNIIAKVVARAKKASTLNKGKNGHHSKRRGLYTIEEEQELTPHLLAGPEDDTDDDLMDNMDLYFPRHLYGIEMEQNEWGTHFLAVTEADDVLVDDADEPAIHYMDMDSTTALLEEASWRSRSSVPPLVEECDDDAQMNTDKGVLTEKDCATKSDGFAISESTVAMEVPVTTSSKLKRKRHQRTLKLNDVFHRMHPDAYSSEPQLQDMINLVVNSMGSYYHKTSDMFVVDVPRYPRRGIMHTIDEEQELTPHLLAGPEDDTDDELMDNMDLYFPRHLYDIEMEQNKWGTHFLAATEADDELVNDAGEPAIHCTDTNSTTAFLEEASWRSRSSAPPLVDECDDDASMNTDKGVPAEKDCSTKSDGFAISGSTVVMGLPVTTDNNHKRKRRQLKLNDVFHLMHPDAYPSEPQLQDMINLDGNSMDSYYHKTSDMFVVDVPRYPRRGLHTLEEEQELTPHLLAGPEDDTDDELMDDMDVFCPRHRYTVEDEQNEWGAHLLVVTEVDELVDNADEPKYYHMDMKDTTAFLEGGVR